MEKTTTDRKSTQRCGMEYTAKVPREATRFFKKITFQAFWHLE